jgi:dnd system-associated protein 4
MDHRISPPNEEDVVRFIDSVLGSQGTSRPYPLFRTKQKLLMFAAALGWRDQKRLPLARRGDGIRYDVFEKALDDAFVDALAVAATDDLKVLSDARSEERLRIFEEFAHAGLREMMAIGAHSDRLLALVAECKAAVEPPSSDARPDLAALAAFFG